MPNCTCRYRRRDRGAAGTPHVLRAISPRLRGRSSSETVYTALVLRRAAPTHMRAGPCSLAWRSYRAQWPGIAGFAVEKADQARNGLARREYMRRHCLCAREAIHYASQHAPPPQRHKAHRASQHIQGRGVGEDVREGGGWTAATQASTGRLRRPPGHPLSCSRRAGCRQGPPLRSCDSNHGVCAGCVPSFVQRGAAVPKHCAASLIGICCAAVQL